MKKPNIFLAILTGIGFIVLYIICIYHFNPSTGLSIGEEIELIISFIPISFALGTLLLQLFLQECQKNILDKYSYSCFNRGI